MRRIRRLDAECLAPRVASRVPLERAPAGWTRSSTGSLITPREEPARRRLEGNLGVIGDRDHGVTVGISWFSDDSTTI